MVEYYGARKEADKIRQYAINKYGKFDIESIKLLQCHMIDALVQVKYMDKGSIHDKRIRMSKMPKKYQY